MQAQSKAFGRVFEPFIAASQHSVIFNLDLGIKPRSELIAPPSPPFGGKGGEGGPHLTDLTPSGLWTAATRRAGLARTGPKYAE